MVEDMIWLVKRDVYLCLVDTGFWRGKRWKWLVGDENKKTALCDLKEDAVAAWQRAETVPVWEEP